MTTFCNVVGALRICRTVPRKCSPVNASTVNVAGIPVESLPTSASATEVSTCIWRRSWAITNSVGAASDAATVCPTSTLREITVPSVGETIRVMSRFTFAW